MPAATQFGKYLLLRRLALGGMAEIWLAKQTGLQGFEKLVVVKRILPHLATEAQFVHMFLDEARLAASLNHPNVVQIYDLGQTQGSYFIAMEFIAGPDLIGIIRKGRQMQSPLPPDLAARVIAGACEGLHYAHTRKDPRGQPLNIVHRDVSPSNILVTYDGGVKVVDFGIAKAESQTTKTQGGKLKGKYSYMSPEQIKGEPLDCRSDIFALGIVLHELLSGRRLFKRDNELAIINAIVDGEVAPPSTLRREIPRALDQIVMRALEKDRRKRFATAQEMQVALERYLSSLPEPPTSIHLSSFMMRLFAEEHAGYQRILSELPSAAPEELVEILHEHTQTSPSHSSGVSGSGVSGSGMRSAATGEEHEEEGAVRVRRKRSPAATIALAMGIGVLVALGALAGFQLVQRDRAGAGKLSLVTDPPGAAVLVDGKRAKSWTPADVEGLPFGRHQLRFERPGYQPREMSIELTPELPSQAVSVTLAAERAAPGRVEVITDPPGATVLLDGAAQPGKTPMTIPEVAAGAEHLVRVSKEGFLDEAATAKVEPEKTAVLRLSLKQKEAPQAPQVAAATPEPRPAAKRTSGPTSAEVALSTTPPSEIFFEGRSLGRTPAKVKLPSGKVALTFVNREVDLNQTVAVNVPGQSAIVFQKGKIAADVTPWADVYLGDRKLGTTPLAPRDVYEGSYTLRLVNSEIGAIKTLKVTVAPGRTTVVREKLE